jgi:predicted nucleic acid-binding protein
MIDRIILDSGALGALAEGDSRMRAVMTRGVRTGSFFEIPTAVIAECLRDQTRNDVRYHRVFRELGGIERASVPLDHQIAKAAGRLLHKAKLRATLDAIVVATAERHKSATIITGDKDDISYLSACAHAEITVILLKNIPSA